MGWVPSLPPVGFFPRKRHQNANLDIAASRRGAASCSRAGQRCAPMAHSSSIVLRHRTLHSRHILYFLLCGRFHPAGCPRALNDLVAAPALTVSAESWNPGGVWFGTSNHPPCFVTALARLASL